MIENAPPGKAKGLASHHTSEAQNIITPRQTYRQTDLASTEVIASGALVKTDSGTSGENPKLPRSARHLPARLKAAIAAARSMPKMHWRWRLRGRDIVALLQSRFGSALPDDDAGLDAAKLLAQHYMRLNIDAERVTRANLRLYASWLTAQAVARLIAGAKKAKTPSAAQLGKHWRVTAGEVANLGLSTITAFTVTLEGDRIRQARRRRNAGAAKKRGRPSLGLSDSEKRARRNAQAAERMRKLRALRKNSHAVAYIRGMTRDEFSVTRPGMPLALDSVDFKRFGIIAIQIMRGTNVVREWRDRAGPRMGCGRRSTAPGVI